MSLQVTYESLAGETGFYLGYNRSYANFTPVQLSDLGVLLAKAMRSWYFPMMGDALYRWSFLRKTGQITLAVDQEQYDLPNDFGGFVNDCLYFGSDARKNRVSRRNEGQILDLFAGAYVSGDPQYYAVRQKGVLEGGRSLQEILLYPVPSEAVEFTFRYMQIPPELSAANPYPLGGEIHGETILAACLAAAEQKIEDVAGLHTANFQRLLAASIAIDMDMAR